MNPTVANPIGLCSKCEQLSTRLCSKSEQIDRNSGRGGVCESGWGYPVAPAGGLCEFLNLTTQFAIKPTLI